MRSGFFNPNSQLGYDLFMQDRQKYFGTAEGGLTPNNPFRTGVGGGGGYRYQPPKANVRQDWNEGYLSYKPSWSKPVILPAIGNAARMVGNAVGNFGAGQGPIAQFGNATQAATGQRPSWETRFSGMGQGAINRVARVANSRAQRRAQRANQGTI